MPKPKTLAAALDENKRLAAMLAEAERKLGARSEKPEDEDDAESEDEEDEAESEEDEEDASASESDDDDSAESEENEEEAESEDEEDEGRPSAQRQAQANYRLAQKAIKQLAIANKTIKSQKAAIAKLKGKLEGFDNRVNATARRALAAAGFDALNFSIGGESAPDGKKQKVSGLKAATAAFAEDLKRN